VFDTLPTVYILCPMSYNIWLMLCMATGGWVSMADPKGKPVLKLLGKDASSDNSSSSSDGGAGNSNVVGLAEAAGSLRGSLSSLANIAAARSVPLIGQAAKKIEAAGTVHDVHVPGGNSQPPQVDVEDSILRSSGVGSGSDNIRMSSIVQTREKLQVQHKQQPLDKDKENTPKLIVERRRSVVTALQSL
jgi:hypothetical protein